MVRETGTLNNLQTIQYDLTIERLPEVEFRVQQVTLPGFNFQPPNQVSPFDFVPQIGDAMDHGNLNVGFQVDERLETWESIWKWMQSTTPEDFTQYRTSQHKASHLSDISLMVMSSMKNVIATFKFIGAFPISLGELTFNTTQMTMDYPMFNVDFAFSSIRLERNR